MKYDLIVVGGGPGGLMAAKTAAEDGLKVVLVERKRNITEINRTCLQTFIINRLTASTEMEAGIPNADGYIDPVSIELLPAKCRFHFPVPGFSVDYDGSYVPYYNMIELSPSGYQIYRYKPNDKFWAVFYQKEVFLAGLLDSAQKAGAEILPETTGLGVENTPDGVKVLVRGKSGEQTLEARKAIAADGIQSKIVESLGLNQNRPVVAGPLKVSHYIVEGLEDIPKNSWISFTVPSIKPFTFPLGLWAGEAYQLEAGSVGSTPPEVYLEKFMKLPIVAPWFRHARVVEKLGCFLPVRMAIREPVINNVVIIGDAASMESTWVQGAIACGYQAAKATINELNGKKGYLEYINWWQQAFAFNRQDSVKTLNLAYLLTKSCTSEEIDYIYRLFQDRIGIPPCQVNKNINLIKEDNPGLYEKLVKNLQT
jgi:flavin-dependent dehydrogenase